MRANDKNGIKMEFLFHSIHHHQHHINVTIVSLPPLYFNSTIEIRISERRHGIAAAAVAATVKKRKNKVKRLKSA